MENSNNKEDFGTMPIGSVFDIPTGCVVVGQITEGRFSVEDRVAVFNENEKIIETDIMAMEIGFMQKCETAYTGQSPSIQLRDVNKNSVLPGYILKRI